MGHRNLQQLQWKRQSGRVSKWFGCRFGAGTPLLLALMSTLFGCELGDNLTSLGKKLANPEPRTVDTKAKPIIAGKFRNLRPEGNAVDGAFIVALRLPEEPPEEEGEAEEEVERVAEPPTLEIVKFQGEESCSLGPAARYGAAVGRPGHESSKLDPRIPFVVPGNEGEPDVLRFTNFACQLDDVEVPGARLPFRSDFTTDPGFMVQTSDEVFFVSPWKNRARRIARNAVVVARNDLAHFAQGSDGLWMWTIEAGQIVARNPALEEVGRVGSDVVQLVHNAAGPNGPMVAFLNSNGELFTASASGLSSSRRIDQDACGPSFSSGAQGHWLLYLSPCAARTLVAYDLQSNERREVGSEVAAFQVFGQRPDGPGVAYVKNTGALWARYGQEPEIHLGDRANLGLSRVQLDGTLRLVVDWDYEGGTGGNLVIGSVGKELTTLAENVVYVSSFGIISRFDGVLGRLYQVKEDDSLTLLQRNVSTQGIRYDAQTQRGLVLVDYDDTEKEGSLTLLQQGESSLMSKRVRPNAYQFAYQLPMVMLLSDFDPELGTSTLKLRRIGSDEELVLADGVSEAMELDWPSAGFLYSVLSGDEPGIWFNQAH